MYKMPLLFFACLSACLTSIAQENLKADVFGLTTLANLDTHVSYTKAFTNSTSYFSSFTDYLEPTVFSSEITYAGSTANESYVMRIGKGGQIYSLTSAFGESVPPQHDNNSDDNGGLTLRPFIDEVWQMVAVDGTLNDRDGDKYFIHQAGVYVQHSEGQIEPFYSPMLAEYFNSSDNSLTVVNWGQQAHTSDNADILHDASVMYYTKYTNLGKGIIQVDNMMYNFGPDTMNHLNVPWGGVRNSTLGNFFVSNSDNTYSASPGQWGSVSTIQVENTGGWAAFSSAEDGTGPTLGLVFTNDELAANGIINWGRVGSSTNPRDYFVFTMIKQPYDDIDFGESMQFRHYYVVGASVNDVKSKIDTYNLNDEVFDVGTTTVKSDAVDIHYLISQSGNIISAEFSTSAEANFTIKATPYENSYPLALITGNDGSAVITTNLYHYGTEPFRSATSNWKLLGYVDAKTIVNTIYATIDAGDSYTFVDGSTQTNITANTFYKSNSQSVIEDTNFNVITYTYLTVTAEEPVEVPVVPIEEPDQPVVESDSKSSGGALSLIALILLFMFICQRRFVCHLFNKAMFCNK
ncbi:hypothetical protein [Paraglaciecola sp. L3A3]|uniref:hypothetical protein n=1 Tax=Paraglaciecola sp. L3A3 TaxID=2686358 RepID=UPI00131BC0B3|nr:hypothetical protein [Paraglaciecola sp. L3A3]